MSTFLEFLFTVPQYVIPQHALSALMYKATRSTNPLWKNSFIKLVSYLYKVDLEDAVISDINKFECFNSFFTRELKPTSRPIDTTTNSILSPVDGAVSELGAIKKNQILQAKNQMYTLEKLLARDEKLVNTFENGSFATLYLSPKDYHRIHMPVSGRLKQMIYVPGDLFSVNARTTRTVPDLFARNERVITVFDTPLGDMVMILVGAIFVGSMDTVWEGQITPTSSRQIRHWNYSDTDISIDRGKEMGRFNMGSTVIVLFPEKTMNWRDDLLTGQSVKMGERIGRLV